MAGTANHRYVTYQIPKRGGGLRTIHHPSKELKALQRWVLTYILNDLPVHPCAFAYRTGKNVADHARRHRHSRYLLRMDLERFFESIQEEDIQRYIRDEHDHFAGWSGEDEYLFCSLVLRNYCLTIGAPTSPALSNAVCRKLDLALDALAEREQVTYTRYADDLYLSTTSPDVLSRVEDEVSQIVEALECPGDLRVNRKKTWHSSKKGRRAVTGLVLGSDDGLSIGRHRKRLIRSLVFRWEALDEAQKVSLAGTLAWCKSVEPDFLNRLVWKYGADRVRRAQMGR